MIYIYPFFLSLPSSVLPQVQPILWAKDLKPGASPCQWPLPWCQQQPEEEGPPAAQFWPWPWPQSPGPQTQLWPRQGESTASRAQPSISTHGERAGLLLPQGKKASLMSNKVHSSPQGHFYGKHKSVHSINKMPNILDFRVIFLQSQVIPVIMVMSLNIAEIYSWMILSANCQSIFPGFSMCLTLSESGH